MFVQTMYHAHIMYTHAYEGTYYVHTLFVSVCTTVVVVVVVVMMMMTMIYDDDDDDL